MSDSRFPVFTPTPQALARDTKAASDRDEALALEILREAVRTHTAGGQIAPGDAVVATAEQFWRWVTSDTWPPIIPTEKK